LLSRLTLGARVTPAAANGRLIDLLARESKDELAGFGRWVDQLERPASRD